MSTHYSRAFEPKKLSKNARNILVQLRKISNQRTTPENGAPSIFLYYSGMSGVASNTAITLENARASTRLRLKLNSVYVRKPNEDSHGSPLEFSSISDVYDTNIVWVFVDDFVASGSTARYCMEQIKVHSRQMGMGTASYPTEDNSLIAATNSGRIRLEFIEHFGA